MSTFVLCKPWVLSNCTCLILNHTSSWAWAHTALAAFPRVFPIPPSWKSDGAQGPRNFPMKWLIKSAQWFAWPTACSIAFGRRGNLIIFSASRDWAAPNKIFLSVCLCSSWWEWCDWWDWDSLGLRAGRSGHVGRGEHNQWEALGKVLTVAS